MMSPAFRFLATLSWIAVPATAQITLFEHADFRGASVRVDSSIGDLDARGWNDRVSSLRVDSGTWEVCRDSLFRNCRTLSSGESLAGLDGGWNDAISSLRPLDNPTGAAAETLARLLYRGLLGRDAEPAGLRAAAAQIAAGRVGDLVRGMTASPEYRNLRRGSSSSDTLDRLYLSLLDRRPSEAERRADLPRIDRDETAAVALQLVSSLDTATGRPRDPAAYEEPVARDQRVEARGSGIAHSAADGTTDSVSGAVVVLERSGSARIDLSGSRPFSLSGSWSDESDGLVRLRITEVLGRGRIDATGTVLIERQRLRRIDVATRATSSGDSTAFAFIADGYTPAPEEVECQRSAREQLEGDGPPRTLAFLAPEKTTSGRDREQLRGVVLSLDEGTSSDYSCDVDRRRGGVIDARLLRR